MLLILLAIVVLAVISWFLINHSGEGYRASHSLAGVLGVLGGIISLFCAIAYVFAGYSWFASEYKAEIINREYGTHYTREEVFYASDVIETVRQLDRKRYEINGDIARDREVTK